MKDARILVKFAFHPKTVRIVINHFADTSLLSECLNITITLLRLTVTAMRRIEQQSNRFNFLTPKHGKVSHLQPPRTEHSGAIPW
jgi:hypothetical protein